MCGIAGRLGPALGDEAPARFAACERRLSHRGPDARGVFRGRAGDGEVALLHTRLAILDLTPSGAQPLGSDDEVLQLVFNGEIYNFRELRAELEKTGARFRSTGDTEVILRAYERWGAECVTRLRGMFAFALWDGRRQELVLARDRLGIKPLFWAAHEGALVFASELPALFALAPLPRELSIEALDDYLAYLYVPPPRTIYRGVQELAPARTLAVRRGAAGLQLRENTYWRLRPGRLLADEEEAARLVRAELEAVVRQHVVSDVPLGAFLSGGLDSTTLVALMASRESRPVRTFCMTFGPEGRLFDEREYARVVADRFSTEHTSVPVRPDVAGLLPRMVRHFGQPFGNPTALLVAELSRQTRKHVTVALAGDGGDEIFLGYPRYLGLRAKARYDLLPAPVRTALARLAEHVMTDSLRGRHTFRRAREFLTTGTVAADAAYTRWVSYFSAPERGRLLRREVAGAIAGRRAESFLTDALAATGATDPAQRASLADLATFLPGNLLAYGDRMSMMHSLELRVPFCDHVLVELLASLTPDLKLRGRTLKWLMRKAMADLLPPTVAQRGKLGFNPPMGLWLAGPLAPMVDELMHNPSPETRRAFEPAAVRALVDEQRSGRRDLSLHVWSLLVFQTWSLWDREDAAFLAADCSLSAGAAPLAAPAATPSA